VTTRRSSGERFWPRILLEASASILVPIAATPIFSPFEQVAVGAATYLVIAVTRIGITMSKLSIRHEEEQEQLALNSEFDKLLVQMQMSFSIIRRQAPARANFSAAILRKQAQAFAERLAHAASHQELRASEDLYGRSKMLFDIVGATRNPSISLVLTLDGRSESDGGFVSSAWNRYYYAAQVDLVTKSGASIRRLFVQPDGADMESPEMKRLIDFHRTNSGFDCRAIDHASWARLNHDNSLPGRRSDFGIWGPVAVYKAIGTDSDDLSGMYFTDPDVIAAHRMIFDAGWRQAQTLQGSSSGHVVGLADLFSPAR
jgi:hypothetical protein